jgi:hypothetical protein
MRDARVTFAAGIALLLAACAVTLTRSPPRVVRAVGQLEDAQLGTVTDDTAICQGGEVLPAGVSGIRLLMRAFYGAPVRVVLYSGSRVLTEGRRSADWTGQSVTVPVKPLARATANVRLCFAIGPNSEPVAFIGALAIRGETALIAVNGVPAPAAAAGAEQPLGGREGVEYLAAGSGSWWSRLSSVASHMGLGRAFSGSWIALLVAALMVAAGVLAVRLTLRELP